MGDATSRARVRGWFGSLVLRSNSSFFLSLAEHPLHQFLGLPLWKGVEDVQYDCRQAAWVPKPGFDVAYGLIAGEPQKLSELVLVHLKLFPDSPKFAGFHLCGFFSYSIIDRFICQLVLDSFSGAILQPRLRQEKFFQFRR